MKKLWLTIVCLLGCLVAFGGDFSETKYYLALFGYDDGEMTPDKTHTWAAYFRFDDGKVKEWHSISWLPRSGVISPMELGPERGINKPFDKTIADAAKLNRLLREWGPFEINEELFTLLEKRRQDLEKNYWYRILDTPNRMGKALDPLMHPEPYAVTCMHAISDAVLPVDPKGWLVTGTSSGIPGTAMVAWHLSDWYERLPSDPHVLTTMDPAAERAINEVLNLAAYPQLQKVELKPQNNHYCRTWSECKNSLGLFAK